MSISTAIQTISPHRDLVPAYYHRASNSWIITGVAKTNGGAVIVGDDGHIVRACSSKRAALAAIATN